MKSRTHILIAALLGTLSPQVHAADTVVNNATIVGTDEQPGYAQLFEQFNQAKETANLTKAAEILQTIYTRYQALVDSNSPTSYVQLFFANLGYKTPEDIQATIANLTKKETSTTEVIRKSIDSTVGAINATAAKLLYQIVGGLSVYSDNINRILTQANQFVEKNEGKANSALAASYQQALATAINNNTQALQKLFADNAGKVAFIAQATKRGSGILGWAGTTIEQDAAKLRTTLGLAAPTLAPVTNLGEPLVNLARMGNTIPEEATRTALQDAAMALGALINAIATEAQSYSSLKSEADELETKSAPKGGEPWEYAQAYTKRIEALAQPFSTHLENTVTRISTAADSLFKRNFNTQKISGTGTWRNKTIAQIRTELEASGTEGGAAE